MPVSEWFAGGDKVGYIVYWKKADMHEDQWDHVRASCWLSQKTWLLGYAAIDLVDTIYSGGVLAKW